MVETQIGSLVLQKHMCHFSLLCFDTFILQHPELHHEKCDNNHTNARPGKNLYIRECCIDEACTCLGPSRNQTFEDIHGTRAANSSTMFSAQALDIQLQPSGIEFTCVQRKFFFLCRLGNIQLIPGNAVVLAAPV